MAEAYLNAKQANISASSSGTDARNSSNGAISWYAQRLLQRTFIAQFTYPSWRKTTKKTLDKADFVVFFGKRNYDVCREKLGFKNRRYEIWDIPDLNPYGYTSEKPSAELEKRLMEASENIYQQITEEVDQLARRLNKSGSIQ